MADGRKIQYLIELLPDTKQFEKIRDKMKAIDGGEFIKFEPSEVKKLKGILQGVVDDVGSRASSIGEKIQKGIASGIDKDKLQKMLDLDTSKLRETMEIVEKLTGLIDDHSKGSSWLKDGKGFLGKLSGSQQELKSLEQSIGQLELKFEGLDASLTSTIAKFDALATAIRSLQDNGKPIVVSPINVTTGTKQVQQFEKEISDLNALLTKLSGKDIEINTDNVAKDFHKLAREADKLSEKIDDLTYKADSPNTSKDDERNLRMQIANRQAQLAQMYREMDAMNQHYQKSHSATSVSLFDDAGVIDDPKDIIKQAREYIESVIKELSSATKSEAKKSDNAIGVEIALPSIDDIKKKLNDVIDQLNKPNSLHKVKLEVDDSVVPIEGRLDKTADAIERKLTGKNGILEKTKSWRKQMLEQFKFKSGDFEFKFSNTLVEELQTIFDEYGLKINIDPTYLADQIKTVLEGSNVSLSGGTANIDQASMMNAVMAGVRAAFFGGSLPTIASPTDIQNKIPDATEQVATEIEQTAKHLDAADEYVQDVVKKIKAVAKYAVKPADKDTAGTKATRAQFKLWGIDLEKVLGATDDAQITTMLEQSLLKRGDFNNLIGSTVIDELSTFKGSSSNTISAFVSSLREMFYMLQEDTDTVDEWTRKKHSREIFDYARGQARAASSLRDVRSPIRTGKIPDVEYIDKAIATMSAIGKNTDSLTALKLAREKLGSKTDEQSIQEFNAVANEFYKNTTKVFYDIKKQAEDSFKGTVYLQGSKKGVVKKQNIESYKQLARVGDDDVILDIRVTSSLNNVSLGTTKSKYKDRISPYEERRLLDGKRGDYVVSPEYEKDILNRELEYDGFKPQGAPTTDVNLDATLEANIKKREVLMAEIKANEEEKKLLREQIEFADKQIADLTAKNNEIPQSRRNAALRKITDQEAKKAQLTNDIFWLEEQVGNGKEGDEEKVGSLTKQIEEQLSKRAIAERQLAELSELDVERRKKSLTNKITEIEQNDLPKLQEELIRAQTKYSIANSDKIIAQSEVFKAQSALKAIPKNKANAEVRAEAEARVTKANRELLNTTERFEEASRDVDNITNQIENSKRKIENLQSQVSETTLETIRQEQIARIEAINNAITSLENEFASKLAEKKAKETSLKRTSTTLDRASNDVALRTQHDLDSQVVARTSLEERYKEIENSDKLLHYEIDLTNSREIGIKAQKEYVALQERVLLLQGQIVKLEADGAKIDEIDKRRNELKIAQETIAIFDKERNDAYREYDELTQRLPVLQELLGKGMPSDQFHKTEEEIKSIIKRIDELKNKITSLGVGWRSQETREYTDAERKTYALEQIQQIDNDLITARAQKNVVAARMAKKDQEIAEVDRWGLGAGIGKSALNKEKYKATADFMNSEYVHALQDALREQTKTSIVAAEQYARDVFDEKVSNAMIKEGMNPFDQTQVGQFLETERGQQYSADFAEQVNIGTQELWAQYDARIKEVREKVLAEFKESMKVKDGVLSYASKTKDENGKWINELVEVSVRDAFRERLVAAKETLEEQQTPIQGSIDRLEADKKAAITYGGIGDKEILSGDIIADQIRKEEKLAELLADRATKEQEIVDLEQAGVADSNDSVKKANKELESIDKQIARYEMLIRNRKKLVELRYEESKEPDYTDEEKELHFTNQIVDYNEKIEASLSKQEELKQKIAAASEEEKTQLQYTLQQEEDKVAGWRGKVSKFEGKLQNVVTAKSEIANAKTGEVTGGLIGVIKEVLGDVNIGNVDLTQITEILQKILAILTGGKVISHSNSAKEDALATMRDLEKKYGGKPGERKSVSKTSNAPLAGNVDNELLFVSNTSNVFESLSKVVRICKQEFSELNRHLSAINSDQGADNISPHADNLTDAASDILEKAKTFQEFKNPLKNASGMQLKDFLVEAHKYFEQTNSRQITPREMAFALEKDAETGEYKISNRGVDFGLYGHGAGINWSDGKSFHSHPDVDQLSDADLSTYKKNGTAKLMLPDFSFLTLSGLDKLDESQLDEVYKALHPALNSRFSQILGESFVDTMEFPALQEKLNGFGLDIQRYSFDDKGNVSEFNTAVSEEVSRAYDTIKQTIVNAIRNRTKIDKTSDEYANFKDAVETIRNSDDYQRLHVGTSWTSSRKYADGLGDKGTVDFRTMGAMQELSDRGADLTRMTDDFRALLDTMSDTDAVQFMKSFFDGVDRGEISESLMNSSEIRNVIKHILGESSISTFDERSDDVLMGYGYAKHPYQKRLVDIGQNKATKLTKYVGLEIPKTHEEVSQMLSDLMLEYAKVPTEFKSKFGDLVKELFTGFGDPYELFTDIAFGNKSKDKMDSYLARLYGISGSATTSDTAQSPHSDSDTNTKKEIVSWITSMSEQARKDAVAQVNAYDKESADKLKAMSDDELVSAMSSLMAEMDGLNKETVEYVQKQRELGNILNAYKEKSLVKDHATAKNGYINPKILAEKDTKLQGLGLYDKHNPITSNKATRDMFEVEVAQKKTKAKQEEVVAEKEITKEKQKQKKTEEKIIYSKEDYNKYKEAVKIAKGSSATISTVVEEGSGGLGSLAREDTLSKILEVLNAFKSEGVKTIGKKQGEKEEKAPKKTEAELIKERALKDKDAVLGIAATSKIKTKYEDLVKLLEAATDIGDIKKYAQKVSALGFNIKKEAAEWEYKTSSLDNTEKTRLHNIPNANTFGRRPETVRKSMEKLAQGAKFNPDGKEYTPISFDGTKLIYQLEDAYGNVEKVTMEWSELNNQVAITSEKSINKLNELANKIGTFDDKFKSAIDLGYLGAKDKDLKKFQDTVAKINEGLVNGESADKIKELRNEALRIADQVDKKVAKNKRMYSGTTEINAVNRQRDNMGSSGILNQEGLALIKEYNNSYDALMKKFDRFKNNGTLFSPKNQKTLQDMALHTKSLGKELEKAANNSERLRQAIDNSGTINGQSIGAEFKVDDPTQVYDQMVAKLKELGAEHIKVDRVRKIATGTIRHNNTTVSDLTVEYDKLRGSLARYQKQERESLTGLPAFLNGFQKKFNSIMQYVTMTMSIHQVMAQLRRGVQYIKEIDLALTELKKVTNETKETYDEFLETASKTAEKVGSTIQKVVSSTADWARLGYSIAEAHELAESTQVLMNVSEFTDVNQATDSLISSIQAFKYTAEESMGVVDILNTVGKQYCRDRIVIYGQADNYNGQRLGIVQTVERLCYKQYKMIVRR